MTYVRLARSHRWPACLLGAIASFAIPGLALVNLQLSFVVLAVLAPLAVAPALWDVGRASTATVATTAPRWDLPMRAAIATALVMLITSAAAIMGPGISGLTATFPLFAAVLAVFAHRHQGGPAAQAVFRGLLLGLFGFIGFFATVCLLVTRFELATTFFAALAVNLAVSAAAYPALRRRSC